MAISRPSSRGSSRASTPLSSARSRASSGKIRPPPPDGAGQLPVMAAANMDAAFVEAVNSVLKPLQETMAVTEREMLAAAKKEDYDEAARLRDELLPMQSDFKQTKQNTLKRLLNESHQWLDEMSKRRRWELQEEFERDEKMRSEDAQKQRDELGDRHRREEQELKDQIYGLMHKSMKFSKAVLEMYAGEIARCTEAIQGGCRVQEAHR